MLLRGRAIITRNIVCRLICLFDRLIVFFFAHCLCIVCLLLSLFVCLSSGFSEMVSIVSNLFNKWHVNWDDHRDAFHPSLGTSPQMFVMIVALGLFHALIALPVLFSLIGSAPYDSAFDREKATKIQKEGVNGNEMDPTRAPEIEGMMWGKGGESLCTLPKMYEKICCEVEVIYQSRSWFSYRLWQSSLVYILFKIASHSPWR